MNHEAMWTDLKKHLETVAGLMEKSIEITQTPQYVEDVGEIYRALQEDIVREGRKTRLRIIRYILTLMESMEEGYR